MRPGGADDPANDRTGPSRVPVRRDEPQTPGVSAVFSCRDRQAREAAEIRIQESKATSNPKGGMPMRRELLNQGLMYGLVSLFVFIVAPLVT